MVEEATSAVVGVARQQSVSGLLHAGGILSDALLGSQTAEHVRRVCAPKLDGGLKLTQVALLFDMC